jgi:hypothetical protein
MLLVGRLVGWRGEMVGARLVAGLVALGATLPAYCTERDPHQRALFVKSHPCPANGATRGRCPGYVVDHIKPLCAGGSDHPSNMQWQTVADGKLKDREERKMCSKGGKRA